MGYVGSCMSDVPCYMPFVSLCDLYFNHSPNECCGWLVHWQLILIQHDLGVALSVTEQLGKQVRLGFASVVKAHDPNEHGLSQVVQVG